MMDAVTIFPALLVLMLAMLTALGYALQRIASARNDADAPLPAAHPCPNCGQVLDAGQDHCPICATSHLLTTYARTSHGAAMVEPRQPERSSRRVAGGTEALIADGTARSIIAAGAKQLERAVTPKERPDDR